MSDDEKRKLGIIDVIAPLLTSEEMDEQRLAFENFGRSPVDYYSQPLVYLYSLASLTQGKYLPLRKKCANFSYDDADTLCATRGVIPAPDGSTNSRRRESRQFSVKPAAADAKLDDKGRLLCAPTKNHEPGGDLAVQEIEDRLTEYFAKRPIYLVSRQN